MGRMDAASPHVGAGPRCIVRRSDPDNLSRPCVLTWHTASLGRPGPAAPAWPRTSIVIRAARGDTAYRWGVIPVGLAPSGAFLDATVWPTIALAAQHNAQARLESVRGEGGNVLSLLSLGSRAALAPTAWARGYRTPTHCTLAAGETYHNVQFMLALYCTLSRRLRRRATKGEAACHKE